AGAVQTNTQISVTTGGNDDLQPELSDSWTTGFVWSPGFASGTGWSDRLDIDVTYYNHEVEGAIQAINAQLQLDLCTAGDLIYCEGISRASTGGINGFNNRL